MEDVQKLKADVQDLLNQIVLKLDAIGEVPSENDDYDGRVRIGKPLAKINKATEDEDDYYDDELLIDNEVDLAVIKDTCAMLLKGRGVRLLEKYYTSTCY